MSADKNIDLVDSLEAEENLLLDFQLLLHRELTAKGWSRADLAKASGISTARLSQIFSSEANPTLKTCARLFRALGLEVNVTVPTPQSDQCREPTGWQGHVETTSNVHPLVRAPGEKKSLVDAVKGSIAARCESGEPQVVVWVTFPIHKAA